MLTTEQLEQLRSLIDARQSTLADEVHRDAERWRNDSEGALSGPVTDTGDRASADLLSDVDSAELNRDLDELRQIESAQQRMAEGRYGQCVDCGSDIDYQRLLAQPAALRCIDCQQVFERTFHQPPRHRL